MSEQPLKLPYPALKPVLKSVSQFLMISDEKDNILSPKAFELITLALNTAFEMGIDSVPGKSMESVEFQNQALELFQSVMDRKERKPTKKEIEQYELEDYRARIRGLVLRIMEQKPYDSAMQDYSNYMQGVIFEAQQVEKQIAELLPFNG